MSETRYDAGELVAFAAALLSGAGLSETRARTVAEILVEGDLMGHDTHGLQLLAPYLRDLEAGRMTATGEPETLSDRGAAVAWDGRYLPGPWLVCQALELAAARAGELGSASLAIRRSHHIACLAAYLLRATERGLMVLLSCSDPAGRSVAPYGGLDPVFTPNPIAAGIPTGGDPILLDVSASITTNGLTGRLHARGQRLAHPWVIDNEGTPSDDPAVLFTEPPGTILPTGGLDHGHKGFALALLVEALSSALAGHGRAEAPGQWGASVFVQVLDPAAFGGLEAFTRQSGWLAEACRAVRVRPGDPPVRLPGSRGLQRRREQLAAGVELFPGIMEALEPWAGKLGVAAPAPRPA